MTNRKSLINKTVGVFAGISLTLALTTMGMAANQPVEEIVETQTIEGEVGEIATVRNGEIQPVMTYNEKLKYFSTEGERKVKGTSPEHQIAFMAGKVGYAMPNDLTFETFNGKKFTFEELKGKKVAISILATWVAEANETMKNDVKKIIDSNEDIVFVQMLNPFSEELLDSFFADAGVNKEDFEYFVKISDESTKFINRLGIEDYPSWIFVDEAGKIAWAQSGKLTQDEFTTVKNTAYDEDALYNYIDANIDVERARITVESVRQSLDKEFVDKFEDFEGELFYSFYYNYMKSLGMLGGTTNDGNSLSVGSLDQNTYIEIFSPATGDEESLYNLEKAKEVSETAKENGVKTIQIWVDNSSYGDKSSADYKKEKNITNEFDYLVDEINLIGRENGFDTLDIYHFPFQLYLNKDGKIVGITSGKMDANKFKEASELFYSDENRIADTAIQMKEIEEEKVVDYKTISIGAFIVFVLSAVGLIINNLIPSKKKAEEVVEVIQEKQDDEEFYI